MMLFIGDDWAEGHHDIEVQDDQGTRLVKARLPDSVEGLARLHAVVAEYSALADHEDGVVPEVVVGIETERGAWVHQLVASGYRVYAVNPMSAARYRERHSTSRAKSDAGDAHVLAEVVRLDRQHHREIAGDSEQVTALKVATRAHQSLIWDRTRHQLRLRSALMEYFPVLVTVFADLTGSDVLELLTRAGTPQQAASLTRPQVRAILKRAGRRNLDHRTSVVVDALRAPALRQPPAVEAAYGTVAATQAALITTLNAQISELEGVITEGFGRHPDADILSSQPGLGPVLGPRVLAEFGDDPDRFTSAKARKNYAGTSPITRASGKRRTVLARHVRNKHLADATGSWAFSALNASPGARAYYDTLRARDIGHQAAKRQLANRLVGILHGCLKTHTPYDETRAWPTATHPAA